MSDSTPGPDVAEMPELMEGIVKKTVLLGLPSPKTRRERVLDRIGFSQHEPDWGSLANHINTVWNNPEGFADGEVSDPDEWQENPELMALHMGILVGIEYERAYPTGDRGRWPVPLAERDAKRGGGE